MGERRQGIALRGLECWSSPVATFGNTAATCRLRRAAYHARSAFTDRNRIGTACR
jgi:hypothetical protein